MTQTHAANRHHDRVRLGLISAVVFHVALVAIGCAVMGFLMPMNHTGTSAMRIDHEAQPATEPANSDPSHRSVVYVCDASDHMQKIFDKVQGELNKSVPSLREGQSFSIVFYQQPNATPDVAMVALSKDLLSVSPENRKRAMDFVAAMKPGGAADPAPALKAGMAMHPDVLYLLVGPGGVVNKADVLATMRTLNADHQTKLMAIAFLDEDKGDEKFLARLCEENGGQYRFVEDKDLDPGK